MARIASCLSCSSRTAALFSRGPTAPVIQRSPAVASPEASSWRGAPPSLRLTFAPPAVDAAVITALGKPPSWREKASPAELLRPLVRAAADLARALALRSPEPQSTALYKEKAAEAAGDP